MKSLKWLKLWVRKLRGQPLSPLCEEKIIGNRIVCDVRLTEDMVSKAKDMAMQIRVQARGGDLKEVIPGDLSKEVIGLKGHFAWFEYAFGDWKEGLLFLTIGKGDVMDSSFRGYSIDVKGRSRLWHDLMMVPEWQFQRHPKDFYIAVQRLSDHIFRIHGYATYRDLKNQPIDNFGYGPTRAIRFQSLRPIEDMLKLTPKAPYVKI